MTIPVADQVPITLNMADKRDVRTQFGALCYRTVKDKLEFLLITSRETGRWVIPKGWPMEGKTPAQSALTEAWEEAGVRGEQTGGCLGLFTYTKLLPDGAQLPCAVMVYPVRVKSLADDFPEARMRRREWMRRKKAAAAVQEDELTEMMRSFDIAAQPR